MLRQYIVGFDTALASVVVGTAITAGHTAFRTPLVHWRDVVHVLLVHGGRIVHNLMHYRHILLRRIVARWPLWSGCRCSACGVRCTRLGHPFWWRPRLAQLDLGALLHQRLAQQRRPSGARMRRVIGRRRCAPIDRVSHFVSKADNEFGKFAQTRILLPADVLAVLAKRMYVFRVNCARSSRDVNVFRITGTCDASVSSA